MLPANAKKAPRILAQVSYPMAGGTHRRAAMSYSIWQIQRVMKAFRAMPPAEQEAVRKWLRSIGGEGLIDIELPSTRLLGLAAAHVAPGDSD